MNTSGEAADQVVRMSLEVGEAALKITGAGAKQLAVVWFFQQRGMVCLLCKLVC